MNRSRTHMSKFDIQSGKAFRCRGCRGALKGKGARRVVVRRKRRDWFWLMDSDRERLRHGIAKDNMVPHFSSYLISDMDGPTLQRSVNQPLGSFFEGQCHHVIQRFVTTFFPSPCETSSQKRDQIEIIGENAFCRPHPWRFTQFSMAKNHILGHFEVRADFV